MRILKPECAVQMHTGPFNDRPDLTDRKNGRINMGISLLLHLAAVPVQGSVPEWKSAQHMRRNFCCGGNVIRQAPV